MCGDLGDQQAALVGQTCFSPGEAKNTYGTGCFMLLNTGTKPVPSKSGLLTTLGYKIGDEPAVYCPGRLDRHHRRPGAVAARQPRASSISPSTSKTMPRQVPDSGGIYFVPAFSGLFAPYWQSDARGVIVGLTRFVNKDHICRAALEATAYQTREVLDAMEKDSGVKLTALKVDGGMVYNDTLMQFQADILGVPVVRPKVAETTALGAAYAAGLAVGFWGNLEDLRKNWQIDQDLEAGDGRRPPAPSCTRAGSRPFKRACTGSRTSLIRSPWSLSEKSEGDVRGSGFSRLLTAEAVTTNNFQTRS